MLESTYNPCKDCDREHIKQCYCTTKQATNDLLTALLLDPNVSPQFKKVLIRQ